MIDPRSAAGAVLALPREAAEILVRWPSGKDSRVTVPPGVAELEAISP